MAEARQANEPIFQRATVASFRICVFFFVLYLFFLEAFRRLFMSMFHANAVGLESLATRLRARFCLDEPSTFGRAQACIVKSSKESFEED